VAGEYDSIWEEADEPGKFQGRTHGCSCCSHTEDLDEHEVEVHIRSLERAIENSKKILEKIRKRKELLSQLKDNNDEASG
jgi:hypothetical protein